MLKVKKIGSMTPQTFKERIGESLSVEKAIARWLVALEDPERLTRFTHLNALGAELEYLAETSAGQGTTIIMEAVSEEPSEETLRAARDKMLTSGFSLQRLRQIVWRFLKLVRKSDLDAPRRRSLFQDLICKGDFKVAPNSHAAILPLCRYEKSLQSRPEMTNTARLGRDFFGRQAVSSA